MSLRLLSITIALLLAKSFAGPLDLIRSSLPESGTLHLIYLRPESAAKKEFFIDFETGSVLHISGSRVYLRDSNGRYSRGTGADSRTGAFRGWEPDEPYFARSVIGLQNPIVQAVLLLQEQEHVSVVEATPNGLILQWDAPDSKKLIWNGKEQEQVGLVTQVRFFISKSGQVLSWQHVELVPESRESDIRQHDYTDAISLGNLKIPKYLDPKFLNRQPPESGVWELSTVELLQSSPSDLFTRKGALTRAAEAAKPMVQAYRDSFYWHDAPNAAEKEAMPLIDPARKKPGPSWGTAFVLSGVVVLSLGVFAWWRSR